MQSILNKKTITILIFVFATIVLSACGPTDQTNEPKISATEALEQRLPRTAVERTPCSDQQPLRKALFGDLHVHTTFSFDAFAYGVRTTPEDAYRFAKGETIKYFPLNRDNVMQGKIKIDRPLDFLAVTDHAEFLGEYQLCTDNRNDRFNTVYCKMYRRGGLLSLIATGTALAVEPPKRISSVCPQGDQTCLEASSIPWGKIIDAAEDANDATANCSFTSFVGYEYSGAPNSSNYHRNVIFRNANVPVIPVSKFEAPLDYYLWKELDKTCQNEKGCEYLTIPHNSNLSNGRLLVPYADLPDNKEEKIAYANQRLAREPIMEIFQHKGSSECTVNGFPDILGTADELCDLEQVRIIGTPGKTGKVWHEDGKLKYSKEVSNPTVYCEGDETGTGGMQGNGCLSKNDFYRTALLTGLSEQEKIGLNSVKLGASASTDTHMSIAGATREDRWRGHIHSEWNKEGRLLDDTLIPSGKEGNPGGLTGVWATENSRDAIFDSMKRREVFGTSGTRIQPRFFAGWDLDDNLCDRANMLELAYAGGVPMGSDLPVAPSPDASPVFLLAAQADPADYAAPLQKLQLIKGWIDADGQAHNKVFDVAGDAQTSAGVNLDTGERFGDGHSSLCGIFTDPEFKASENAYYYMRAVENPSPRWSLIDCLEYSDAERPDVCDEARISTAINEQAWTSPIWYSKPNASVE